MRERKNFNQGYRRNFFVGKASITVVSLALIFMMAMLYISQSNQLASKTDTLHDLEVRKAELQKEKERLEYDATRLQSIQEIQKATDNDGSKYVPVRTINYLPSTSVALK